MFEDLTSEKKAKVMETIFNLIESTAADILAQPEKFSSFSVRGAIGKNVITRIEFEPDSNARIAVLAITERILERIALTFGDDDA